VAFVISKDVDKLCLLRKFSQIIIYCAILAQVGTHEPSWDHNTTNTT